MPPRDASDDRLDALLGVWAERSRLTEAEAEAILTAIVRTAPPAVPALPMLGAAWWQDVVGRVNGMVVQLATMPEAAQAAVRQAMLTPMPV